MPQVSVFVKRVSYLFGIEFQSIIAVQEQLKELLRLLDVDSVDYFLKQFPQDFEAPRGQPLSGSSFIEMAEIGTLVLGKKTAFNQSRRYYDQLATKALSSLSCMRTVLQMHESCISKPESRMLVHLAWSYSLYQQYMALEVQNDISSTQVDVFSLLHCSLFGTPLYSSDLAEFNIALSRFLLKWRLILTRLYGNHARFAEAFSTFAVSHALSFIQLDEAALPRDCFAFLKRYDYHDLCDFCGTVLTYIMPYGKICLLDAVYRLYSFVQRALGAFAYESAQGYSLETLLTMYVQKDMRHYTVNVGSVDEPEMLAILLVFLLTGELEFFDESIIARKIKTAFRTIKRLVGLLGERNETVQSAFSSLLRRPELLNIAADFQKKRVRTGFNSSVLRDAVLEEFAFDSGKNIAECLLDVTAEVFVKIEAFFSQKDTGMLAATKKDQRSFGKLDSAASLVFEDGSIFCIVRGLERLVSYTNDGNYRLVLDLSSVEEQTIDSNMKASAVYTLNKAMQMQQFGQEFEDTEQFSYFLLQCTRENDAMEEENRQIEDYFRYFSEYLLHYANDSQKDHFREIKEKDGSLEALVQACSYLVTMTRGAAQGVFYDRPDDKKAAARLYMYLRSLPSSEPYHAYDVNAIDALCTTIERHPLMHTEEQQQGPADVLSDIFSKLMPKVGVPANFSVPDRAACFLVVYEEFEAARAIPQHQFFYIQQNAAKYVKTFAIDTLHFADSSSLKLKLKQDANDIMRGENDAALALFVALGYLGFFGFSCEYGADGVTLCASS